MGRIFVTRSPSSSARGRFIAGEHDLYWLVGDCTLDWFSSGVAGTTTFCAAHLNSDWQWQCSLRSAYGATRTLSSFPISKSKVPSWEFLEESFPISTRVGLAHKNCFCAGEIHTVPRLRRRFSEVTKEIQRGYYGRELDPTRPNDPKDQQGFAYPVYVAFLLAPTVTMPFEFVRVAFRWLLIFLTAATVPLWLRTIGWRASWITTLIWVIATLGSFAAVQGIKLQQLTLLVCALIAAAMAALAAGHLVLAGALLAVATIKPQLLGILSVWLLFWTLSDWRARKRFAVGFLATLLILTLGGEWILPGWISKFRAAAKAYIQYTGGG